MNTIMKKNSGKHTVDHMSDASIRRLYNSARLYSKEEAGCMGYNIYLERSGHSTLLMMHCTNGKLYLMLKDGMSLGELHRWTPAHGYGHTYSKKNKQLRQAMENVVGHLIDVVDSYFDEIDLDAA